MGLYEQIRDIAKEKGYSVNKLEKELGFARSSINKFNKNRPSLDKIQQIADYLNVSVDYLMTGNDDAKKENISDISNDNLDVAKDIDRLILQMSKSGKLTYDGKELLDVEVELFRKDLIAALDRLREYNRLINSSSGKSVEIKKR